MTQPAINHPFETPSIPIRFANFESFTPWYSPLDMLQLGVFGGSAFPRISDLRRIPQSLTNFVEDWTRYAQAIPIANINATYVDAPLRRRDFQMPSPIRALHVGGWFQWYCEFYYGLRSSADPYRIEQWGDEVRTCWIKYGSTASTVPQGQWLYPDKVPIDGVKIWIQHLLHFSWPFNQVPTLLL